MSLADWRGIAGRVSATYGTSLPVVMRSSWPEVVRWWHEAAYIDAERYAPMRALAQRMLEGPEE